MWHSLSVPETLKRFKTSSRGLSTSEARERRRCEGPNELAREAGRSGWKIFSNQFASPLVLLLIGASVIAFALGERTETIIILLMILLGAVLGFVQEYRSELSLRLLRKKLSRRATVVRNGVAHRIDARELVPGDVVELDLGAVVPADVRLITVQDLEIDESTLTGESSPVAKITEAIAKNRTTPQQQTNMAFLGSHVVQGSGTGVVVAIGRGTEMGHTALLLTEKTEETSFQRGVREFGSFLLKLTVVLAFIVFVILGLLRGQWAESLLFALALAVGISPELLPVIVTLNLSRGALAMSRKHVLVKRLISIEDLGNADVFCTDKTGTLTVGKLRVQGAVDPDGLKNDDVLQIVAPCIATDARSRPTNPVDAAIADATRATTRQKLIDLISFDFTRRRMSCVIENDHGIRWIFVKGAVTETLAVCTARVVKNGQLTRHLTPEDRKKLLAYAEETHRTGTRLVAVARRQIGVQARYTPQDEKNLELIGFILVSDAPKESARAALASLRDLGVRIVILTGDDPEVTRAVTKQLAFEITGIVTGDEIERMEDHDLTHAVETSNVFARITPSHKLRILRALKAAGHRVGFIGDGVNDAPALRAADVGISFESAVDVAKEAAGIILLQKNLSVLADGIREGRKTFVKTQTYIRTTISSNFGNMLSVAGAALMLPFIPLLPAQILLLNLIGDLPMLATVSDRVSDEDVAQPKKWDVRLTANFMYFFGTISSVADYATFSFLLFVAHANVPLFRSGWFLESIITQIIAIFLLRSRRLSIKNIPSLLVFASAAVAIAVSVVLIETPLGQTFAFVPLGMQTIGVIVAIVIGYAILTELGKIAYARFQEQRPLL